MICPSAFFQLRRHDRHADACGPGPGWLTRVCRWYDTAGRLAQGLFCHQRVHAVRTFMELGPVESAAGYARGFSGGTAHCMGHAIEFCGAGCPPSARVWAPLAGAGAWALFCMASAPLCRWPSRRSGMAFAAPLWPAARLSAYNLVIFAGVFTVLQWGIGAFGGRLCGRKASEHLGIVSRGHGGVPGAQLCVVLYVVFPAGETSPAQPAARPWRRS